MLRVTPFAGVWIEIGRKSGIWQRKSVTPFAGVWIEINFGELPVVSVFSHSLRGSVD